MFDKPFEQLEEADIQQLITDQVRENKQLEYKEALPGNPEKERREFLADVSSMANAAGGRIIYGVAEQRDDEGHTTGLPGEPLVGMADVNADAEIRRLEDLLRAGVQPRIQGVRFLSISLSNGNTVLAISVPRSWSMPHVVNYQGHWRFYSRNEGGKYPMDVDEVRRAMTTTQTVSQYLHEYRLGRLAQIVAGETPVSVQTGPKLVLHILPLTMLDARSRLDVAHIVRDFKTQIRPIYYGLNGSRINVDGVIGFTDHDRPSWGYTQLFRSGAIESVECALLQGPHFDPNNPIIPSVAFEKELMGALRVFMGLLRDLEVAPPVVIMLSLLGVRGFTMAVNSSITRSVTQRSIDRDDLILPEVLVDDLSLDPASILRPIFDMVWNACGFARSFDYDDQGKWTGGI